MAMAAGIIGAVVQGVGTFMQMQAQAAAAEYNKDVSERNRRAVIAQTDAEVDDKRKHDKRVRSAIRATYASNGFELAGSPMDVMADTIMEQEYDVAKLKLQGHMKAEGYREQATLYGMEADAARTAGFIGLATGLLSGVGNAFGQQQAGSPLIA